MGHWGNFCFLNDSFLLLFWVRVRLPSQSFRTVFIACPYTFYLPHQSVGTFPLDITTSTNFCQESYDSVPLFFGFAWDLVRYCFDSFRERKLSRGSSFNTTELAYNSNWFSKINVTDFHSYLVFAKIKKNHLIRENFSLIFSNQLNYIYKFSRFDENYQKL